MGWKGVNPTSSRVNRRMRVVIGKNAIVPKRMKKRDTNWTLEGKEQRVAELYTVQGSSETWTSGTFPSLSSCLHET